MTIEVTTFDYHNNDNNEVYTTDTTTCIRETHWSRRKRTVNTRGRWVAVPKPARRQPKRAKRERTTDGRAAGNATSETDSERRKAAKT